MRFTFKKKMLPVCFIMLPLLLQGQIEDSSLSYRTKNIIWFTPNGVNKINGIAIGLQAANLKDRTLAINGVNASAGLLSIFVVPQIIGYSIGSYKRTDTAFLHIDTAFTIIRGISLSIGGECNVSIHGINIAGFVTGADKLNGISITGYFSKCNRFNGVSISGFHNIARKGRGLQIGLFNRCKNLKGVQIGLWNKSGKRGLPFINWGF